LHYRQFYISVVRTTHEFAAESSIRCPTRNGEKENEKEKTFHVPFYNKRIAVIYALVRESLTEINHRAGISHSALRNSRVVTLNNGRNGRKRGRAY